MARIVADILGTGEFEQVAAARVGALQAHQYPACFIQADREVSISRSGQQIAKELAVVIEVVCLEPTGDMDAAVTAKVAAVQGVLEQDRTLNGLADHCWEVDNKYYVKRVNRPVAGCVMTWRVHYVRSLGTP